MTIEDVCHELTPALLLSSPGRWRLIPEEDEFRAPEPGVEERVTQNASRIIEWVEEKAPKALQKLSELLAHEHEEAKSDLNGLCLAAVACCRFISVRLTLSDRYSLNVWTDKERNLWTSPKNGKLAEQILLENDRLTTKIDDHAAVLRSEIVDRLLLAYLKPLFQATPSANIHQETGRRRTVQGQSLIGAAMEEDVVWKGGDVTRAKDVTILGHPVVRKDRHLGLGCESVLYACCESISRRASKDSSQDVWAEKWPLVLPPLLQLLEDPSPRFRLAGVRILSKTVLSGYEDERQRRRIGSLLLRTGVADLLRQTLTSSLTFLTSRLAGALLQSTAEAWIRLTFITTFDPSSGADGGRQRYEQLSQLVDEGILRVWAYAPTSVTLYELEETRSAKEREPSDVFSQEIESDDVIDASIDVIVHLARRDMMGIGIVRYLDVLLEFLTQQIAGVETKVDRLASKARRISLLREVRAARAIVALLRATKGCPTVQPWCARCLTYAARCWKVLTELSEDWPAKAALQEALLGVIEAVREVLPEKADELSRMILGLDPDALGPLFQPVGGN